MIDAAIKAMMQRIASPNWADDLMPPPKVGPEYDSLADDVPQANWSQEWSAAFAALRAIRPQKKLAVLSLARNEAPYLAEWIAHYRAIGADQIFIYTNNNSDGTDELLRWFSAHEAVTPIFNSAMPGVNVQRKNYQHALLLLPELRLYDWVAVVDADEFLVPAACYNHHLPTLLAAAPSDTDAILFPWRWRQYDRSFERQPGLLAERYPYAHLSTSFKSVMRLSRVTALRNAHAPSLESGGIFRDTNFAAVTSIWDNKQKKTDEGGWLDHYWGKSFEEYVVKKRRADDMQDMTGSFRRDYNEFFDWGGRMMDENFSPVPEAMMAAMKRELTGYEAKPGYAELKARLDAHYTEYANTVRNDTELRRVYEEHFHRFLHLSGR